MDYPEHLQIVCLDLVLERQQSFLFQILVSEEIVQHVFRSRRIVKGTHVVWQSNANGTQWAQGHAVLARKPYRYIMPGSIDNWF